MRQIHLVSQDGALPLHYAAAYGHKNVVEKMLGLSNAEIDAVVPVSRLSCFKPP